MHMTWRRGLLSAAILLSMSFTAGAHASDVTLPGSYHSDWKLPSGQAFIYTLITDQRDPNVGRYKRTGCAYDVDMSSKGSGILTNFPSRQMHFHRTKCMTKSFVKIETSKKQPNSLFLNHTTDLDNMNQGGVEMRGSVDFSGQIVLDTKAPRDGKTHYIYTDAGLDNVKLSMVAGMKSMATNVIKPYIQRRFSGGLVNVSVEDPLVDDSNVFKSYETQPKITMSADKKEIDILIPAYTYPVDIAGQATIDSSQLEAAQKAAGLKPSTEDHGG
jgi:hypothetical protein